MCEFLCPLICCEYRNVTGVEIVVICIYVEHSGRTAGFSIQLSQTVLCVPLFCISVVFLPFICVSSVGFDLA